ncbi:hypothetical protein SAMN04488021_1354 [Paracoccus aminovorans]|uniref:AAA+ family ATPase n=1 Tax=Paracoccus aminovorans TaxID=34004 RepID=A0A1I3D0P9_9RHOB|nr:hypothetical protein [Paracoccus aminovorans]CQR86769.1 hypothetical protein JCM7685_2213 [Paracoccus aminovorans]SFH80297.1 hypothetical protein SAMN04488021_1354 [Paracoccus aminovorans]
MRNLPHLILAAALLAGVPAAAQDYEPPQADEPAPDGTPGDSLEGGIENFMRNLLNRAEPHLDRLGRDLGDTLGSVTPVLKDIGELMDDVRNYQAPERLENGDILIRRRPDAPPPPPVGNALREMLRPAPEDDPRLNPPPVDPEAPMPMPPEGPANGIEL